MKIIIFSLIAANILFVNSAHALTESEKSQAATEVQKAISSAQTKQESLRPKIRTNVTGLEWLQMSAGDRLDSILTSMYILTQHGVELQKLPNDYYNAVEEKLRLNPSFYPTNVTNILASIVYETEPDNREALDRISKKPGDA